MTDSQLVPTPAALLKGGKEAELVEVPARTVAFLDGEGSPADPSFAASIGALYGVVYVLRALRKASRPPPFKVGPLEGAWRAEGEHAHADTLPDPEHWQWSLRLGVPDDTTDAELATAVEVATTRRKGKLEGSEEARRVRLARIEGGRYARILHEGPYVGEPESFYKIAALLAGKGLRREPWHLEVYLSDPGRTPPEKLKTVLLTKVR